MVSSMSQRFFLIKAIIIFLVVWCETSNAQWVVLNDTSINFSQIVFSDSLKGYIVGAGGTLFTTVNGGKNWIDRKISARPLLSVSAIGDSLIWVSDDSGRVYHSLDGGKTWQNITVTNSPFNFYTVQFVDSLNGWVTGAYQLGGYVGYDGIFHSSDGGLTWKEQYADTIDYFSYLWKGFFSDKYHGYVADQYVIHRTTDGGSTWILSLTSGRTAASIFFIDSLHGWAACDEGFLGKTTDGGINWSMTRPNSSYNGLTSVFFVDSLNGWVCDNQGGIIHTTDGGNTWIVQRSDTSGYPAINSLYFLNKNEGWAVGNGIVLHTTNGGVTAIDEPSQQPTTFRLFQNYPNPFNPATVISYQLSALSNVTLTVYDILGREVATLVEGVETAGFHTVTWNASKFASGVYIYRLMSNSSQGIIIDTKQMVLIK